ncbi:hypothetical protein JCM3775_000669 [Rhodotorula graminis]
MGLDITKGALKPASKPKTKPKPAHRFPHSPSPPTPSSSSSHGVTGTPHSPAATAPASLASPQVFTPRIKQTAKRGRRPGAPVKGRGLVNEEDALEAGRAHQGSLGAAAQDSTWDYGVHGESARGRQDESVAESPRIVVDATASDSSGSGGSDSELEAHLNGPDSPWFRQHASVVTAPVGQGGRRFGQPSASTSRSSAIFAARRDPFDSAQDYSPLEHQQGSASSGAGLEVDVDKEEMTPEPQATQGQGQGSSSPASQLESPAPTVFDGYARKEKAREQEQGQGDGGGPCEGPVGGEVGVTGSASPDVPLSHKRRIDDVLDDEADELEGRRKRAETVDEDELDNYDDNRTLSFLGDSQDGGSASPDPRAGTSFSQRTLGSRSTTLIETFLRSDTPYHDDDGDEAFERDESPLAASEEGRGRRQSTPFPPGNGDGDTGSGGQRSSSFSPAPAEHPSSSSLEQAQPAPAPAPRRTRTVLPPSLAEHYGAEVTHPHYHHATLLAASAGAASQQEREDGPLSWDEEKEGFVRRFAAVTEQVGELFDRQASHFAAIAHELEQHGERLAATAHKLDETKERVREWGKPMFEAARGGGEQRAAVAAAAGDEGECEGGEEVKGKAVEEGDKGQDGAEVATTDENGEA